MAEYDESEQRLSIKLVYYGPALSGKTTSLAFLHDVLQPELKGEIMMLDTGTDRTLFFDLLPLGFRAPSGLLIKFKLFTVPGQVAHDATRKAVLSRADGVVFVADSQADQGTNNAESFENLANNIARVGLDFATLPVVIQFNKRDLPNIVSEAALHERWRHTQWPLYFSSALCGEGVTETFAGLLAAVYRNLAGPYELQSRHGIAQEDFLNSSMSATAEAS